MMAPLVWGATGLMVTPVITAALAALSGGLDEGRLAGDALRPWVYVVVYASFGVQGIGIASLFAVRASTAVAWRRVHHAGPLNLDLAVAVVASGFAGAANLSVAAAFPLGTWGSETASGLVRTTCWVTGSLCLTAAVGSVMLTRGRRVTAALGVWIGTGAMVCWSSYTLVVRIMGDQADTAPPALLALTAAAGASSTVVWIRRLVLAARGGAVRCHEAEAPWQATPWRASVTARSTSDLTLASGRGHMGSPLGCPSVRSPPWRNTYGWRSPTGSARCGSTGRR